jgi:hypothetical protein
MRRLAAVVVVALCASLVGAAEVKPLRSWRGYVGAARKKGKDERPRTPPAERHVKDAKTWESLWKRLRGGEAVPKVDFTKELVLVVAVEGDNTITVSDFDLDKGTLSYRAVATKNRGEGFSYVLVVLPSAGVEKVR